MPGKAAKVVVTERQRDLLVEFSKSRTESQQLQQRAEIILLAFAGQSNQQIAAKVGLGRHPVGLWRRRWRDAWEELTRWECAEPHHLREALHEMFRDAPRAGCPGTFSAEQVVQVLAVACEPPEKSGRPITHWTHAELRDELVKRQIVPEISVSQVGRYLQAAALQPQRREMWINTTEKDPQQFKQEVEQVCTTYLDAPAAYAEHGTHTVSVDEMTGVQALERAAPDQPMAPHQPLRQEFEYRRHGTTTLIAGLCVVTGCVVNPVLGPTRTEADFLRWIQQVVATAPQALWVFVADRLNIHWSESLVRWIAGQFDPDRDLGVKGRRGILKSQASRRAYLSDLSHPIRFVYLPKHSSWLNQIEILFGIVMRKVVRRGSFTSVADLESTIRQFLKYYNEVLAHPFAWTYTGRPLATQRPHHFCPLHRRAARLGKVKLAKDSLSCSLI